MIDKIKAIRPHIIVTGTVEKPYYEILYYDTADGVWHIGYSSYNLANVVKWKEEFFEVVGEIEDMQPTADVVGEIEDMQPTADVVEIPCSCRECKYYKPHSPSKHHNPKALYCCRCAVTKVKPDDFCSFGERRTGNDL